MAEGYLLEECLTFCSRYMEDIETQFNKKDRIDDDDCGGGGDLESLDCPSIFRTVGRSFGKVTPRLLTTAEWDEIHFYVLNNCEEVQPYLK